MVDNGIYQRTGSNLFYSVFFSGKQNQPVLRAAVTPRLIRRQGKSVRNNAQSRRCGGSLSGKQEAQNGPFFGDPCPRGQLVKGRGGIVRSKSKMAPAFFARFVRAARKRAVPVVGAGRNRPASLFQKRAAQYTDKFSAAGKTGFHYQYKRCAGRVAFKQMEGFFRVVPQTVPAAPCYIAVHFIKYVDRAYQRGRPRRGRFCFGRPKLAPDGVYFPAAVLTGKRGKKFFPRVQYGAAAVNTVEFKRHSPQIGAAYP